jgi:menaquinol-cytochrome c reductase iron-sulfur subunit
MTRRDFLKRAILFLGGFITASLGALGGGYFLAPLFVRKKEDWAEVGSVANIPVGVPTKVDFAQRRRDGWVVIEGRSSAWILTPDGKNFTAYDPHCTHLGCPYNWDQQKKLFRCPCHGGVFGIDGGIVSGPIPRPLDRLDHKIVGGKLYVRASEKKGSA